MDLNPLRLAWRAIKVAYRELVHERRRELPFWMLLAFVLTVVFSRLMVYVRPDVYVMIWGTHVHHFAWGIVMMAVAGFAAIVYKGDKYRGFVAVLYGIAIGLIADESALWLKLDDVYYSRLSIEIMIGIVLLLGSIVYLSDFWKQVWKIISKIRL